MKAATHLDIVIGIDIHFELVPPPVGAGPTPFPHPFIGMLFDPAGLAIGVAITNIGELVTGKKSGPVYINGVPAATVGTEAINLLKHIPYPPGTGWAPVPRLPPPALKPGQPARSPASPLAPSNDGPLIEGSETVTIMGISASRNGEMVLTCGEPVRIPLARVMTVPKGRPVSIGGPSAISIIDVVFGLMRTRWLSGFLHSVIARVSNARLRSILRFGACFLTGHPVDIATGRVLTSNIDFELAGPMPLIFKRVYNSGFARRPSPLGYGWSHSFDQSIWEEPGKVVYLGADGREIEFTTLDLPDEHLAVYGEIYEPINRLTLKRLPDGCWRITDHELTRHEFATIPGDTSGRARLQSIEDRNENVTTLLYEADGRLVSVVDSVGRTIRLAYDERGMLSRLYVPNPEGGGDILHTTYHYDEERDLVRVTDPRRTNIATDFCWRYEYVTHLLVAEIDRENLGFYFGYDGLGQDAYCVRTWGHDNLLHRELRYDKVNRKTIVKNSLGHCSTYEMNEIGLVIAKTDPAGHRTSYEYDHPSLQKTRETDALGQSENWELDDLGRPVRHVTKDGRTSTLIYGGHVEGRGPMPMPTTLILPNGAIWQATLDLFGNVRQETDPLGFSRSFEYKRGLIISVRSPSGRTLKLERDDHGNAVRLDDHGRVTRATYDGWGRPTVVTNALGTEVRLRFDLANNLLKRLMEDGTEEEFVYHGECNVTRVLDAHGLTRLEYDAHYQIGRVIYPDETVVSVGYDTENRLTSLTNENGDTHTFELDACGKVRREVAFDGTFTRYSRDALNRVVRVYRQAFPDQDYDGLEETITYDAMSRMTRRDFKDGTFQAFERDALGEIITAENEHAHVAFTRDLMGRITRETCGEHIVESSYGPDGERVSRSTSLRHREAYLRNRHGELVELETGTNHRPVSFRFRRDALGQIVERTFPGGARERREYHEATHLPRRRVLADASGETIGEDLYDWDAAWLRKRWSRMFGLQRFDHDPRGRLVATHTLEDKERDEWRTDWRVPEPAGNLFRTPRMTDHAYSAGGVLREAYGTTYETNLRGQRVLERYPDDTERALTWTASGQLASVLLPDGTLVEHQHDALGRRIRKIVRGSGGEVVVTSWRWDDDVLVHERVGAAPWTTWIHDPDGFAPFAMKSDDGFEAIVTDYLGSPSEGLTEMGQLAWSMQLDSFGVPHSKGDITSCPWRFPGQYEDRETGLYQNRHRYYQAEVGAYLSRDPIGFAGGVDLYGYVPDPFVWIDPLGLDWNYVLVNKASGDVYYAGRASDNDTPSGVRSRHRANEGSDGFRFVDGADELVQTTPHGTNPNAVRGLEHMSILGGTREGVIGRARDSVSGLPRRRGNSIRGISLARFTKDKNPAHTYRKAALRFLRDAGLQTINELIDKGRRRCGV